MIYPYLVAFHIIAVICWFAGLFYIGRCFVYHAESNAMSPAAKEARIDLLTTMERRVWYGISWPSAIVAISMGLTLAMMSGAYHDPWIHAKMAMVVVLVTYHFRTGAYRKALLQDAAIKSSRFWRFYNEVPVLLLIPIVCVAATKQVQAALWGALATIGLGVIAMTAVTVWRRFATRAGKDN